MFSAQNPPKTPHREPKGAIAVQMDRFGGDQGAPLPWLWQRRMNGGLTKTLEAGGITETRHNELRGNMVGEMAKGMRGQSWYNDRIPCGEALAR